LGKKGEVEALPASTLNTAATHFKQAARVQQGLKTSNAG
jgi:hypothetical protein